jgi:hypothetical protein
MEARIGTEKEQGRPKWGILRALRALRVGIMNALDRAIATDARRVEVVRQGMGIGWLEWLSVWPERWL